MSASPAPAVNPFSRLWSMGYRRLVPIVPPQAELSPTSSLSRRPACRGKAVGLRGSSGRWYGFNWHAHETVEADCETWRAMGAGIGCRTGEGLVAIDIDTLDPELSARAMAAAHEILGPAPRRIGRAPKVLLPYRVSETTGYQRVQFKGADGKLELVEMLGEGRQFVVGGIHPVTMKPYAWPDGIPDFDALTQVSHTQIAAFFQRLIEIMPEGSRPKANFENVDYSLIDQNGLRGRLEDVRAAVRAIPNDRSARDLFIRIIAATKASIPDEPEEALDIVWEWASQFVSRNGRPKTYESFLSDYNGITAPFGLGAQYLYDTASAATGQNMTPADRHFEIVPEGSVDTSAFPNLPAKAPKTPLTLVRFDEAVSGALTDRAKPLVKGLLDQTAMSVLYGDSNTGKTFVALDIAYAISRGLPWGGMKTTRLPVVYVVAEGSRGARRRVAALQRKYGDSADFYLVMAPIDLLRPDGDLRELVVLIKSLGVPVGFLVIDTLSRAMAGGDENSSVDMGAMVRHLDLLREHTQAHVMVVHHSGKEKSKGARGHSLLRAATDTEIEVEAGQLSVSKQRDLDKTYATAFELDVVTLGQDEDGEAITSCTVRLLEQVHEATPGVPTPKEGEVLRIVEICADTASDPSAGVSAQEVEAIVGQAMSLTDVRFHLRNLVAKNLVVKVKRGRWKLRDNLSASAFFNPVSDVFQ